MKQDNNVLKDASNTPNEKKNKKIEEWRNEHGQPSLKFLQSLADDGDLVALEKLKSIADSLDVDYNHSTSSKELVRKIILTTQGGRNTTR